MGRTIQHRSGWAYQLAMLYCLALVGCMALVGCSETEPPEVVVFAAVDADISQAIFNDFTSQTGIMVRPIYDMDARIDREPIKLAGLSHAILAERERPSCDLFWNNDILQTMGLDRAGLLRAYESSLGKEYPPAVRSSQNRWYGFAARARVLIVNKNRVATSRRPKTILDLVDRQWYDQAGIAKPLTGTAATHAACLFQVWGEERAKEFFHAVKRNGRIMATSDQVARAVASGALAFGLTDSDHAMLELEKGMPVEIVFPDQQEGEVGTLFIPNTLALIKGSVQAGAAEKLLEYLLSPAVERVLAEDASAQIPLHPGTDTPVRLETPQTVRAMEVDFVSAADRWETVSAFLTQEFSAAD